jgi:hypothetical protein
VRAVDHVTPWAPAGGKAGICLTPLNSFLEKILKQGNYKIII